MPNKYQIDIVFFEVVHIDIKLRLVNFFLFYFGGKLGLSLFFFYLIVFFQLCFLGFRNCLLLFLFELIIWSCGRHGEVFFLLLVQFQPNRINILSILLECVLKLVKWGADSREHIVMNIRLDIMKEKIIFFNLLPTPLPNAGFHVRNHLEEMGKIMMVLW